MKHQLLVLLAGALTLLPIKTPFAQEKPNIVVILADDLGYADLGCYGGEIPTPNLDNLAKNGVRFTNFYNTARCCPSRASLLTGVYSHQAGIGHMMEDQGDDHPAYRGHLNEQTVTIAEVLKEAGYFTAMTGKWHVGQPHGVVPWKRGFDRSLNAPAGGFYYGDSERAELFLNGRLLDNYSKELPENWYSTDLWTDYGLRFIDDALAEEKPFLLYLAHNVPHFPLQAPEEEIQKFKGKYLEGWEKLRQERYERQLELGLIDSSWKLPPFNPNVPKWDSLSDQEKEKYDHIMAIYAAVIAHLDKSIGDLVAGLKDRSVLDNTVILFVSDNGGNAEPGAEARYIGENPGSSQSTVFLGQGWAEAACTPFWSYKHHTHEGGISSPGIVFWPAGIPATRRGTFERQSAHITDILATLVDLGGASYPETFKGNAILPTEGTSLKPAFSGQPINRKNPIFWEHEGNRAVLDGRWKLVAEKPETWQLYDLEADRTELHNLIVEESAVAARLKKVYEEWSRRVEAEPWDKDVKWFYDYEKAKKEAHSNQVVEKLE
ncbi:arylsulfatase [Olivibacter sp. SDN3]|uniref:arylsulfatase n=1 Tax=Olivibacter sp. SDN3 TaxID=2764720 RepID=UPI001651AA35|nr:arylsulfatase [Olivibacter sp. SDN3]QNL51764.1 arylsulfatase [Olivibacter sp. SDN3]